MMIVRPSLVQSLEQVQDFVRRRRVEVAGRLIRQNEFGVVDQAAGDRHALLLAAGKLRRPVIQPLAQARPSAAKFQHRAFVSALMRWL